MIIRVSMEMPAPASWQPVQSQLDNTRPYPQEKCVDRQGFVVKLSNDSGRFSKDSGRVLELSAGSPVSVGRRPWRVSRWRLNSIQTLEPQTLVLQTLELQTLVLPAREPANPAPANISQTLCYAMLCYAREPANPAPADS